MDESGKVSIYHEMTYRFLPLRICRMCGAPNEISSLIGLRLNSSQGFRPKSRSGIAVTVSRCNCCGLIYPSYLPIPCDMQDHYGIPPDDYWVDSYFVNDENYFSREIEKAKWLINYQVGMTALDIGAGLGKCMIALSSAGFDVEGLEPSIPFREKAIERMGINPDKLKLGMIEDAEYPDDRFDFITFGAVLEHLYDPGEAIVKALKWVKKDGVIQIEVPSSDWLISKLVNAFYKISGVNYVTNISPMHAPFHIYEFTLKCFTEHGSANNYQVVDYEYSVCSLIHIPKLLHPLLRWYMERTNTGMQLTVWLKRT